jgi:putative selenate reductase
LAENGRVVGLECLRNELGEPGRDGRRKPIPVDGSEFRLPADSVVYAIGQAADTSYLEDSTVALAKNGAVHVEPQSGQASTCVYAGGDLVRGPAIIIEACADGRRAAEAICQQLNIDFEPLPARRPVLTEEEIIQVKQVRARKEPQVQAAMLPPAERSNFGLVEQTLTEAQAQSEAGRCMQCATLCDKCVEVCPNRANASYQISPISLTLPQLACQDGRLVEVAQENFAVSQTRQIVHIDDLCNECGNCATFCVHTDKPYRDKPRLFLDRALFEQEEENAFFIEGNSLWRRQGGKLLCLTLENGAVKYEDEVLQLDLDESLVIRQSILQQEFAGEFSMRTVAEMLVLFQGLRDSLPFLAS